MKQFRKFIGFVSYYRKFVVNFSNLLWPLNNLLRKNIKWEWGNVQQKALDDINKSFLKCITLKRPNIKEPYLLRCDASGLVIAAILSQINDDGEEMIIEVTSRCLNKAEKGYSTTEKELLAIVNAVK